MPTLGGNDTLRGFRNYRFRGPHALLLQAEYRWELWSGLDGALFYDAGKVALRAFRSRLQAISKTITASAFASTPPTASSCASTRPSAAATASTCTSSLEVCSESGGSGFRRAVAAGVGHVHGAPAALLPGRSALDRRRHGARRLEGRRAGRHQRLRLRRQLVPQPWRAP